MSATLFSRVVLTSVIIAFVAIVVGQQIQRFDIDFSKGQVDPVTGQICVMQQVCLSNAEELAKRLPQEPCFPVNI
jgi:Na+-transporting NADH:ubiquinone oxidoreductase subunit NqrD